MFAVIGHAVASKRALPYAGPISGSRNGAIDAWLEFAVNNGEIASECQKASDALKTSANDTLVYIYGGDEVLTVQELVLSS